VFLDTVQFLQERYGQKLFWDVQRLTINTLKRYEQAIKDHGDVSGIWGWVDGTCRAICRPSSVDQRPFYFGHKKYHCFKYQGITTPDGLMSSLAGPANGSIGDWRLWNESGNLDCLRSLFGNVNSDQWLYAYGDAGCYASLGVMGEY
jgi:hypothetical protein